MGLTLTEKDHFTNRLLTEMNRRIDEINDTNPLWKSNLQKDATTATVALFNVAPLLTKLAKALEKVAAAESTATAIEAEIASRVDASISATARDARDEYRYANSRNDDDDLSQYPIDIRASIRAQIWCETRRLEDMHPVGLQLEDLHRKHNNFRDSITMCANHTQLSAVWREIVTELGLEESATARANRNIRIREN